MDRQSSVNPSSSQSPPAPSGDDNGRNNGRANGQQPLTRKDFYDLANRTLEVAQDLARHDQNRVSLKHCHDFNNWLPQLKAYDLLAPELATLKAARPIARWQILVLGVVLGLVLGGLLPESWGRTLTATVTYGYWLLLLLFYFVPERLYGTTIELLEAKVLRVVESMEKLLYAEDLEFTEAVFFQLKEKLETARTELRQQIDLAHRRWR